MHRTDLNQMKCSIARTFDVIGDTWMPLILRDVFMGLTRFDTIQEDLGISRKVLASRLDTLVEHGILQKVPYQQRPVRHDYVLTRKGAELAPVMLAVMAWGDRWTTAPGNEPVLVRHTACDHLTAAVVSCAHCEETLHPWEIDIEVGPELAADDGPEAAAARARIERRRELISS